MGLWLVGLWLGSVCLSAQTATTATLEGRVVDTKGRPVEGVRVHLYEASIGLRRESESGRDGRFHMDGLPAGNFDLEAAKPGFATVSIAQVHLVTSVARFVSLVMRAATRARAVLLTDQFPLVPTTATLGVVLQGDELRRLPSSDRQLGFLASLAPGAVPGFHPDVYRRRQRTVGMGGGGGRNVLFTVDGAEHVDNGGGGALGGLPLEAIAEVSVQTGQSNAVYGGFTAGVLHVVTRAGTRRFAGTLVGQWQDEEWAREARRRGAGADWAGGHFGGSLGGPLFRASQRGAGHFFAAYEARREDRGCHAPCGDAVGGPSVLAVRSETRLGLGRATYRPSPAATLEARYLGEEHDGRLATTGVAPALTRESFSVVVGYARVRTPGLFSELRGQWSEGTGQRAPGLDADLRAPASTHREQDKLHLRQALSGSPSSRPRHRWRAGLEWVHEPLLRETVVLPGAGDGLGPVVAADLANDQWRGFFQHDWWVHPRLDLEWGLRYEYSDLLRLDQTSNPIWQRLAGEDRFAASPLQDFAQGRGGVLEARRGRLAPRLGLAWDVHGRGRHLVRGGWGLYHAQPHTQASLLFPAVAAGVGARDAFDLASPTLTTPSSSQLSLGYSWQVTPWLGFHAQGTRVRYRRLPFRFRTGSPLPAPGEAGDDPVEGQAAGGGTFRLWYGRGRADYRGLNLSARGRFAGRFELRGTYVLSRTEGNVLAGADGLRLTDPWHQPDLGGPLEDATVDPRDPLCRRCLGPLNTDARHRLTLGGSFRGPLGLAVAGILRWRSSLPYTLHAGRDLDGDGSPLDLPPGVAHVNSLRGASHHQVDVRVSRDFAAGGSMRLELVMEIFNLFGADNPAGFIGSREDERFRQATLFAGDPGQAEPRLVQLGLRLRVGTP